VSISTLILTLNEEINLSTCLESLRWSDDIVVLDCGSMDRTLEIAKEFGARVFIRKFDNERNQRMFSFREIPFKHPWVYNPDADEVTPADLQEEMLRVVSDLSRPEIAYRVRFKTMFMGKWIRYSSLYPTWVMRLFRPEKIHLERAANLTYIADGPVGYLQSHFIHNTFNRGLDSWIEKHNNYSHYEAIDTLNCLRRGGVNFRGLLSISNPVTRRQAIKELSFRLPFRSTLRFIYMYLIRLGFLDGWPGLTYCRLMSIYEYLIILKMKELRRKEENLRI
jgi:glycosyltransferase involved in cell wall biosynthesis